MKKKVEATPPPGEQAETGRRILMTAIRLFAERGYDEASMRDIASEVGIKASSIYNHYRDKAALLTAIVERFREELRLHGINEWNEKITGESRRRGERETIVDVLLAPFSLLYDPLFRKIAVILMSVQSRHEEVRSCLYEETVRKPHELITRLVRESGLTAGSGYEAEFIAAELQSALLAYFYRRNLDISAAAAEAESLRSELSRHVSFVLERFSCGSPLPPESIRDNWTWTWT